MILFRRLRPRWRTSVPLWWDAPTRGRAGAVQAIIARYGMGLLSSSVLAIGEVITVLRLLVGTDLHVIAAVICGAAAVVLDVVGAAVVLAPSLGWFAAGIAPSPQQRSRALAVPIRHSVLRGWVWLGLAVAMLVVHRRLGGPYQRVIAISFVLGALACCCMGYLVAERVLRPVFAAALSRNDGAQAAIGTTPRRPRHGVGFRLVITWALCTAFPLFGIVGIGLAKYTRWLPASAASNNTAMLLLAAIAIFAGFRSMILAARSVADPLREVTEAMVRIGAGDTGVRTLVYDTSEIGALQSGFNAMAAGIAERERLHDLFGRHVGREVARAALRQGVGLTGAVRRVAVLFIDLTGSTAFAADNPADRVATMLNAFFRHVVQAVDEHGGVINKFEGDAALALFGAPVAAPDPAGAALATARALRASLAGMPDMLDFGIGISYGDVFAGNIGAEDRYEYTVIGDSVNEAARLSDLAKQRPGRVLAAASCLAAAGTREAERWVRTDSVTLRGRPTPTALAEPRDTAAVR